LYFVFAPRDKKTVFATSSDKIDEDTEIEDFTQKKGCKSKHVPKQFVQTVPNCGAIGKTMKNQCLWISLCEFLKTNGKPHSITVEEIRTRVQTLISQPNEFQDIFKRKFTSRCKMPPTVAGYIKGSNGVRLNGPTNMFEYMAHGGSAEAACELYDISIHIYYVCGSTLVTRDQMISFGSGSRRVNIAYFNNHFELIIDGIKE
jgi:hypothetical protein